MPNHWHFVLRPETDSQLSDFFRWLTHTHTMRWHAHDHTDGTGHLYQGRFKTFPIEADDHLLAVLRYVERNPLRASLCERAEDWWFGSFRRRKYGTPQQRQILNEWSITRLRQWVAHVNRPRSNAELTALRNSVRHGAPYGSGRFVTQSAARFQLDHERLTYRHAGRVFRLTDVHGKVAKEILAWGFGITRLPDVGYNRKVTRSVEHAIRCSSGPKVKVDVEAFKLRNWL